MDRNQVFFLNQPHTSLENRQRNESSKCAIDSTKSVSPFPRNVTYIQYSSLITNTVSRLSIEFSRALKYFQLVRHPTVE